MAHKETRADQFKDSLRKAAADTAETLESEAKTIGSNLKSYFGPSVERVCHFVRKEPVISLLLAVAVGIVIGRRR